MKLTRLGKAIKRHRTECHWFIVGVHRGFHPFGNAPSRFDDYVSEQIIFAKDHTDAVYRYVKRWENVINFNSIYDTPTETTRMWSKYSVAYKHEIGREIQKVKYFK